MEVQVKAVEVLRVLPVRRARLMQSCGALLLFFAGGFFFTDQVAGGMIWLIISAALLLSGASLLSRGMRREVEVRVKLHDPTWLGEEAEQVPEEVLEQLPDDAEVPGLPPARTLHLVHDADRAKTGHGGTN